jgi:4-amino-4-deoxy-L-arabinose transferase-like glycosyltransferase
VRWAVLLGWAALGAHNLVRLPHDVGFDAEGHWEYIRWIANGRGVPLATDGWQMFQPPLYYALSAPFQLLLFRFTDAETAMRLLRIVPFVFGAVQVQLAYLALRYAFRTRADLQAIGTAFAGVLPMNLYLSQSLGNEPMAGCLSGAALVAGLRLLELHAPPGAWALVAPGALLGLALLTKISAILVVPPLVGAIVYVRRKDPRRLRAATCDTSIVAATAAMIAGWYYVRNWIRLGRPFVGGWDPSRGIEWWQDPGYRTPAEFVRFGEALVHPIIAGAMSFWDAVYSTFWADSLLSGIALFPSRPPWNYGFLLASVQLALVPTLLLLAGTAAILVDRRPGLVFAGGAIAVQGAALVNAYLRVPYYAIGKAHYTLGVVVCYAILLAAGVERCGDHPVTRALLYGALAAWGFAVCAAYVVV